MHSAEIPALEVEHRRIEAGRAELAGLADRVRGAGNHERIASRSFGAISALVGKRSLSASDKIEMWRLGLLPGSKNAVDANGSCSRPQDQKTRGRP